MLTENSYWLSRAGGPAEGPFVESQLLSMWRAGRFTATDHLCLADTEDWMDASSIMRQIEEDHAPVKVTVPEPPVPALAEEPQKWAPINRRSENGCVAFFCFLGALAGFLFFWPVGLVLLLVALMIEKTEYACGNCGNKVASTSVLCPVCHVHLGKQAKKKLEQK